jgi:predicted AlkP superfamily phosphohydrolase/phosphomutase
MLAAVLAGGPLPPDDGAGAIWRLRAAIPPRARGAIARALPDRAALELTARLELRGIDWSQTAAFAHPADNQGYVRLNLRGREREGIVAGADAAELLDRIAAGLQTFCDPDGQPAVACVDRVAEHYVGARAGQLPDLVVQWSERPATMLTGVHSPRFGDVLRRGSGSGRSGNHTPGDAWAVVAPGVSSPRTPVRPPRLADVASTIAAVCGVDGSGLAGEPLLSAR